MRYAFASKFNSMEGKMPVDFEEVLAELETEEARLVAELAELRSAMPALRSMKKRMSEKGIVAKAASGRFSGMGATKAIPLLLEGASVPLTYREVHDALKAEGWTTGSSYPESTVAATLSQLKDKLVEKIGEGWRLRRNPYVDTNVDQGITDEDIPF